MKYDGLKLFTHDIVASIVFFCAWTFLSAENDTPFTCSHMFDFYRFGVSYGKTFLLFLKELWNALQVLHVSNLISFLRSYSNMIFLSCCFSSDMQHSILLRWIPLNFFFFSRFFSIWLFSAGARKKIGGLGPVVVSYLDKGGKFLSPILQLRLIWVGCTPVYLCSFIIFM